MTRGARRCSWTREKRKRLFCSDRQMFFRQEAALWLHGGRLFDPRSKALQLDKRKAKAPVLLRPANVLPPRSRSLASWKKVI
ncbi:hypothetical protein [Bacillus thermotolerans]|uniref:hypothetical protein n=1 Tax=Bacillus thermotolerans TaxID=1221996 RepID=UPI0006170120|nr:hypothetical protein [Bacillus thermotolerans]